MKKLIPIALMFLLNISAHAQWTDNGALTTTSDNIEINGTLDVNGNIAAHLLTISNSTNAGSNTILELYRANNGTSTGNQLGWKNNNASGSKITTGYMHSVLRINALGAEMAKWEFYGLVNGVQTEMFEFGDHGFNFRPKGIDLMTIKPDGKVGIGTSNPGAKLSINQNTTGNLLRLENDGAGNEASIRFRSKPSSGAGWLHADIGVYATGDNQGHLGFKVPHNNNANSGYDMVINHAGNVGIGYTNPQSQLIVGSSFGASISGTSGGNAVFGTNLAVIQGSIDHNKLYTPYSHGGNYGYAGMRTEWGRIHFYTSSENTTGGNIITPATRMFIGQSGNVGIGTTSPVGKLDINPGGWGGIPKISFDQSSDHPSMRLYRPTGATNPKTAFPWWIENSSQGKLVFKSGSPAVIGSESVSSKIAFLANGNVGIGTTNPGSFKLAVEGKIGAREVNVTAASPWPDYVFEKNYNLRTLEETKAFISENKHLPEIPSASEISENGIDIGDMNMKLLKKIEELTLHMIRIDEELQSIKAENNKLKEKMDAK